MVREIATQSPATPVLGCSSLLAFEYDVHVLCLQQTLAGWYVQTACDFSVCARANPFGLNYACSVSQVPVCEVSYVTRFLLNAVLLPTVLISLVAAVWATNRETDSSKPASLKPRGGTDSADEHDELRISKYSDYYFAIFLTCEFRSPFATTRNVVLLLVAFD